MLLIYKFLSFLCENYVGFSCNAPVLTGDGRFFFDVFDPYLHLCLVALLIRSLKLQALCCAAIVTSHLSGKLFDSTLVGVKKITVVVNFLFS